MQSRTTKHKPLPKQIIAYKAIRDRYKKYIVYGGAAGGGKSWLGCEWLMTSCYHLIGTRWFIGRNNLKDTRESVLITWSKVAKAHRFSDFKFIEGGIKFLNGSEVVFLDLTLYPKKDPYFERFGSKEFTGGWIEEAGEVNFGAFDTLKSRVGRHLNKELNIPIKILMTCNPKKNWLYKEFYKPHMSGTITKEKAFIQALPTDNPHLTDEYIESLRSISDKAKKERLLFGNWEYDDDPNCLINFDAIMDIFDNIHVEKDKGKKAITADIAGRGSDKFIVAVWDGFVMIEKKSMGKSGGKEILDTINNLRKKHDVPPSRIVYDSDGVGFFVGGKGGFIPGAKSFHNGASPIKVEGQKEDYENLKAQCTFKMADRINRGGYYLKCINSQEDKEDIQEELEYVKERDSDKDGKLRIERKEVVKSALGRSPDWKDVIMMREYLELLPKTFKRKTVRIKL